MQFSKSITGCKYGDDFATFWGRTLLEMVCKNQVLTIGTKLLEMGFTFQANPASLFPK